MRHFQIKLKRDGWEREPVWRAGGFNARAPVIVSASGEALPAAQERERTLALIKRIEQEPETDPQNLRIATALQKRLTAMNSLPLGSFQDGDKPRGENR